MTILWEFNNNTVAIIGIIILAIIAIHATTNTVEREIAIILVAITTTTPN